MNYDAWNRLAQGKGIMDDARYMVHEIAEVKALSMIQQNTSFDFMGTNFANMSAADQIRWKSNFDTYYHQAHSEALHREYVFLAGRINTMIGLVEQVNPQVLYPVQGYFPPAPHTYSATVIAAADPTRHEALTYMNVNGIPLGQHRDFKSWEMHKDDRVHIPSAVQRQYRLPSLESLSLLIGDIKRLPIP